MMSRIQHLADVTAVTPSQFSFSGTSLFKAIDLHEAEKLAWCRPYSKTCGLLQYAQLCCAAAQQNTIDHYCLNDYANY